MKVYCFTFGICPLLLNFRKGRRQAGVERLSAAATGDVRVPYLCTSLLAVSYLRQCLELSVNNGYGVLSSLLSLSLFLFPFFFHFKIAIDGSGVLRR